MFMGLKLHHNIESVFVNMDVDDPKVDPEGQGHRSKVKVTR